eukprot:283379-Prorocentrum_minimum.AAC.3
MNKVMSVWRDWFVGPSCRLRPRERREEEAQKAETVQRFLPEARKPTSGEAAVGSSLPSPAGAVGSVLSSLAELAERPEGGAPKEEER